MAHNPLPPLGQAAMAASLPVTIASDQSAVPVSGTITADLGTLNGAATEAKQDTIIGHVDGIEAAVELIDDIVQTEDDAHSSGHKGVMLLGVQNENQDSLSGTDKDYTPIAVTNYGAVLTTVVGQPDVTVSGAALTALQLIDDPVQVLGTDTYTEATSKGMTIGAVRRDADTTLVNTTNEFGPLQMDANGRLKVEAFSGETLPVSLTSTTITGTVAVTQSGTWDEVGINDSGNSITIDNAQLSVVGSGTEAAALRVTIATDSTGVLSVDDNGSSLTVDGTVTVSGVSTLAEQQSQTTHLATIAGDTTAIQAAVELIDDTVATLGTTTYSEATTKGVIIGAVRRDADTTLANTTNEVTPLQVDANGYLKVEIFDGGGSHTIDGTVTADLGATDNAVLDAIAASVAAIDTDTTTVIGHLDGVEGLLSTIDADTGSILTSVQLLDDTVFTEDSAHTTADKGIQTLAVRRDSPTALGADNDYSPQTLDANGATWVSLATKLDATNDAVAIGSRTTGGLTTFRSLDLDETEEEIKGSAGQVYGYYFFNAATSTRYLKFYNATAANVTVGSTTPLLTLPLPAGAAANVAFPQGIAFSTAITAAATTGVADADTGAPGANDVITNVFYT